GYSEAEKANLRRRGSDSRKVDGGGRCSLFIAISCAGRGNRRRERDCGLRVYNQPFRCLGRSHTTGAQERIADVKGFRGCTGRKACAGRSKRRLAGSRV